MLEDQRKYLWVFPTAEFRWLWKPLAGLLAERLNLTPILIVPSPQDVNYYRQQYGEDFGGEIVVSFDPYLFVVEGGDTNADKNEIIRRAAAFEQLYDISLMRDLILVDRHLGRPYMTGGQGHPRSLITEKMTADLSIAAATRAFDFYEKLFDRYPPGLVISQSISGLFGKPTAAICRKCGIPIRMLFHSRFAQRYYWAEDELGNSPQFLSFLRSYSTSNLETEEQAARDLEPTGDFRFYLNAMDSRLSWFGIAKQVGMAMASHTRAKIKGYRRAKVAYLNCEILRHAVRLRRQWQYLSSSNCPRLVDVPESCKLVFFPLQVEPENSLPAEAPYWTDQLALAREISLSLPADTLLIVKEHPIQVGRRPQLVYEKLEAFHNTVLMNIEESSYDIIRKSDLVITINSSAGYEAAVLGKPVIQLSPNGTVFGMDHVQRLERIEDFGNLPFLIDGLQRGAAKRRKDGARYYFGSRAYCLDFGNQEIFDRDREPSDHEISVVADHLLQTLLSPEVYQSTMSMKND